MSLSSLDFEEIRNAQAASLSDLRKDSRARWDLQSDLLYELMTYGDGHNKSWRHVGNWNSPSSIAPRAILTWLVMRALGIERLPWLHDRVFSEQPSSSWEEVVEQLRDPVQLGSATEELRALHAHTVQVLRRYQLDPLLLSRSVEDLDNHHIFGRRNHGYASRLAKMACAAARLDRRDFEIPIDVLSSWSVGGYPKPVTISCLLPSDWIGWGAALVASRDNDRSRDAVEGGEWVVVCREASGHLKIPTYGVSAWASFCAPPSSRTRARHDPVAPDVQRRLALLKIDRSLYLHSDAEAEELLASGAQAYGTQVSGYDNRPFYSQAQLQLSWRERLSHAAYVLIHARPK